MLLFVNASRFYFRSTVLYHVDYKLRINDDQLEKKHLGNNKQFWREWRVWKEEGSLSGFPLNQKIRNYMPIQFRFCHVQFRFRILVARCYDGDDSHSCSRSWTVLLTVVGDNISGCWSWMVWLTIRGPEGDPDDMLSWMQFLGLRQVCPLKMNNVHYDVCRLG